MAEILLEPSSRSKIIPLSFDLNDTSASNAAQLMTKRQFNTADTDAWFQISLDDFVDTAGSFDITLFNLNDKSVFNHTGKPFTTNPFYYKLDSESDETTNEIRHAGRWIGQIVVTLANGDSATRKFIFDIEGHILDGADVQTILLEDYNALIALINTSKDLLTQYNVDYAALLVDLAAAETTRTATYNQLVADQQANIDAFDVALDTGIVAANLATKLQDFEATNNSRLLSAEQQLAETAKKTEKIVSVKEYGAVGDGLNDDTTAIQNTINALNAGDTLLMPNGTYRTTSTITVDKEITIDGNQATIECDHLLIGLKIKKAVGSMGYGSARRLTANISVSRKMLTTDPNAIGVEITDCYRGWFDFKRLSTHGIGMRLVGEKDGTTYNRFNLGSVTDCYVGIQAETLTDVGWVTENTVYGGNFGSGNITSKNQTDAHIKLLNSDVGIMDNNKFFSCSFEGFQKNGVIIDRAKHNLFFGCRFEVPFADFLLKLLDATDNQSNQFWGCFGLAETLKNGKIYDEGTKNRISGSEYPVGGFEYYEKTVYYFNKPGQVKQTGFNSGLTVIPLGGRTLREITASASSLTIDFSRGDHFDVTCVTGVDITTIAFANIPSNGVLPTISFIQAAGGNTISGFPSYFLSAGDAVPVKRAYGRDVYQLARGNAYTNEIYALSHYKN